MKCLHSFPFIELRFRTICTKRLWCFSSREIVLKDINFHLLLFCKIPIFICLANLLKWKTIIYLKCSSMMVDKFKRLNASNYKQNQMTLSVSFSLSWLYSHAIKVFRLYFFYLFLIFLCLDFISLSRIVLFYFFSYFCFLFFELLFYKFTFIQNLYFTSLKSKCSTKYCFFYFVTDAQNKKFKIDLFKANF